VPLEVLSANGFDKAYTLRKGPHQAGRKIAQSLHFWNALSQLDTQVAAAVFHCYTSHNQPDERVVGFQSLKNSIVTNSRLCATVVNVEFLQAGRGIQQHFSGKESASSPSSSNFGLFESQSFLIRNLDFVFMEATEVIAVRTSTQLLKLPLIKA
jgi:hypothetical protein